MVCLKAYGHFWWVNRGNESLILEMYSPSYSLTNWILLWVYHSPKHSPTTNFLQDTHGHRDPLISAIADMWLQARSRVTHPSKDRRSLIIHLPPPLPPFHTNHWKLVLHMFSYLWSQKRELGTFLLPPKIDIWGWGRMKYFLKHLKELHTPLKKTINVIYKPENSKHYNGKRLNVAICNFSSRHG